MRFALIAFALAFAFIPFDRPALAQTDSIDHKEIRSAVSAAFSRQTLAYQKLRDRVNRGAMTPEDRVLLLDTNNKKRIPKKDLLKTVDDGLAALASGNWTGPVAEMDSLAVGSVGLFPSVVSVVSINSANEFQGYRTEAASIDYLFRGWSTAKLLNGQELSISGMAVISGMHETRGKRRLLIVEPIQAYSRRKDDEKKPEPK